MFKAIDNWIINKYQVGYTYVWNYTGITKGLIGFVLFSTIVARDFVEIVTNPSLGNSLLIIIALSILYSDYNRHVKQKAGKFKELNSKALEDRDDWFTLFIRYGLIYIALPMYIFTVNIFLIYKPIVAISYFYMLLVMVTDRELPEKKTQISFNPT